MPVRMTTTSKSHGTPQLAETHKLAGLHRWRVRAVAISVDGTRVVSASSDKTLCVWDAVDGHPLATLTGHTSEVHDVAFVDATKVVSGSADKSLRVWDINAGDATYVHEGAHGKEVTAVAASGSYVVSASADKSVKLWGCDGDALIAVRTLSGHTDAITAVAMARDGGSLASASYDGSVRLWSLPDGEELHILLAGHAVPADGRSSGLPAAVTAVAFAPDGRVLASGLNDGTLLLWSKATGSVVLEIPKAHSDKVASICFVGSCVVSGGRDDHVRIHSASTGKQLAASKNHVDCVVGLAAGPDGVSFASGSHDQTVRLWRVSPGLK